MLASKRLRGFGDLRTPSMTLQKKSSLNNESRISEIRQIFCRKGQVSGSKRKSLKIGTTVELADAKKRQDN